MTQTATTMSTTTKTASLTKLPAHAGAFEFQYWLEAFLINCDKNYGQASRIWIPPSQRTPQNMPFNPINCPKPSETVEKFYSRHEALMDESVTQILNLKRQICAKETEIKEATAASANLVIQQEVINTH
ncbi:hypothetical protein HK100_003584 [Physocladia obscura]|uniref:Uncharacterized protein n=1 Tax=Physocladia obscura TaxID=109957 RepID=A0AAD5SZW1_9FUNG|nr:hypothetical protein HK100_003584 [Physocladia obscura]